MAEVRYHGKSPQQRIADRQRNSGGDIPADVRTKTGDGPQRVFHNVHNSGTAHGSSTKQPNANDRSGGDR
jgi:hypothetical protein